MNRTIEILDSQFQVVDMYKLPKQLRYWAKLAGLKENGYRGRNHGNSHEWKGFKRYWRINCHGRFECSERFAMFDRWANSASGASISIKALTNEKQFQKAVKSLRAIAWQIELDEYTK